MAFQTASNACADMAGGKDLQGGGALELSVTSLYPGTDPPGNLSDAMKKVTQGFLGAMISGQQQFADAAVDLFQCAGDFKNADRGVIPL